MHSLPHFYIYLCSSYLFCLCMIVFIYVISGHSASSLCVLIGLFVQKEALEISVI